LQCLSRCISTYIYTYTGSLPILPLRWLACLLALPCLALPCLALPCLFIKLAPECSNCYYHAFSSHYFVVWEMNFFSVCSLKYYQICTNRSIFIVVMLSFLFFFLICVYTFCNMFEKLVFLLNYCMYIYVCRCVENCNLLALLFKKEKT
jgi:hypothetical protein